MTNSTPSPELTNKSGSPAIDLENIVFNFNLSANREVITRSQQKNDDSSQQKNGELSKNLRPAEKEAFALKNIIKSQFIAEDLQLARRHSTLVWRPDLQPAVVKKLGDMIADLKEDQINSHTSFLPDDQQERVTYNPVTSRIVQVPCNGRLPSSFEDSDRLNAEMSEMGLKVEQFRACVAYSLTLNEGQRGVLVLRDRITNSFRIHTFDPLSVLASIAYIIDFSLLNKKGVFIGKYQSFSDNDCDRELQVAELDDPFNNDTFAGRQCWRVVVDERLIITAGFYKDALSELLGDYVGLLGTDNSWVDPYSNNTNYLFHCLVEKAIDHLEVNPEKLNENFYEQIGLAVLKQPKFDIFLPVPVRLTLGEHTLNMTLQFIPSSGSVEVLVQN